MKTDVYVRILEAVLAWTTGSNVRAIRTDQTVYIGDHLHIMAGEDSVLVGYEESGEWWWRTVSNIDRLTNQELAKAIAKKTKEIT